jgi:hypothetical protein
MPEYGGKGLPLAQNRRQPGPAAWRSIPTGILETWSVPMTRSQTHAGLAIGATLLVGVAIAFLPPVPPASAQSQAQRICREEGVKPATETYEYCLSQATRSLEWGEPALARGFARVAMESRDACLGYGLQPQSDGFKACLDKETQARSLLILADEQPTYGPQIANQPLPADHP